MKGLAHNIHLETRSITARDKFEVWRSYFPRTLLDLPDPSRATRFQAEGNIITRPDGVMFTAGRCEATKNYMSGSISDFILFGSILDGESVYTHAQEDSFTVTPFSGLAMLAPRDKVLISNHYHRYALFVVPKCLAQARLGFDVTDRDETGFLRFPAGPMAQMLEGLLRMTARNAGQLDGLSANVALNGLLDFAMAMMMHEESLHEESFADADRAYYSAICGVIRKNAHDPALDAATIAHQMGISRSSLFRILGGMDDTVGQLMRRIRLDGARNILVEAPERKISDIAGACGYSSAAAFSRIFRAETGMSPTDWRRARGCRPSDAGRAGGLLPGPDRRARSGTPDRSRAHR